MTQAPSAVYATAHCYGAPMPDERVPTINVLSLSADGGSLELVQEIPMPAGTLMPASQAFNTDKTRLFSVAGKHGVVAYQVDPADRGKISTATPPSCSAVTVDPLPTPYGVMPVDITLDPTAPRAYTCNLSLIHI